MIGEIILHCRVEQIARFQEGILVIIGQLSEPRARDGELQPFIGPADAAIRFVARQIKAAVKRQLVFDRIARILLKAVLEHMAVRQRQREIAEAGWQGTAECDVDAARLFARDVDRVHADRRNLARQPTGREAGHARDRVPARRRVRIEFGIAIDIRTTGRFVARDLVDAQVIHLIVERDAEIIDREVKAA